jgi:hypothetical protein
LRASSLSNAKVIDLLNGYFVPVYLRNQDFADGGSASPAEKAQKNRIYREALEAGLPAGTVCAYLLTSTARPLDTAPLNRPEATDPERMAEKLTRVVRDLKVAKGDPVVRPKPQSPLRESVQAGPDSLVVHLTARYLQRKGDDFVRFDTQAVLGSQKGGNWGDLPSEGWIVLERTEWTKILPSANGVATRDVRPGTSWEPDKVVAAKLLNHFFPPTENTDLAKNRIDEQSLVARVETVENGLARARLDGRLKMKHPFYHKDDGYFVNASLVGYLDIDVATFRVRSFRLVTDDARYSSELNSGQFFGVAVRSVP